MGKFYFWVISVYNDIYWISSWFAFFYHLIQTSETHFPVNDPWINLQGNILCFQMVVHQGKFCIGDNWRALYIVRMENMQKSYVLKWWKRIILLIYLLVLAWWSWSPYWMLGLWMLKWIAHFYCLRDDPKFPQSSGSRRKSEKVVSEAELPQKVLQSLFNMPTPKEAEQEPNKMNWRNIVKKMVSLGQGSKDENEQQQQHIHGTDKNFIWWDSLVKCFWLMLMIFVLCCICFTCSLCVLLSLAPNL